MKQKVLDFINRIQTTYFERRNLNQVFEALDVLSPAPFYSP